MKKETIAIAAAIKSADADNASRKAIGTAIFATLDDKRTTLIQFLGRCGVTKTTCNILNPDFGEFEIAIDTPHYCDPGYESYHSM